MDNPLADARYSVDRAQEHISDLEREIAAFRDKRPYRPVVEYDRESGLDTHKIVLTERLPRRLPGLAFDAGNNLRSALDQAGHAVALAANLPGKRAHFPFGKNEAEVRSRNKGKSPSSEIPRSVFDVMAAFKPYPGGNTLLWALNKLANTQKHETITAVVVASGVSSIHIKHAMLSGSASFPPRWDSAKNEMVIMQVAHGHTPNYHLQFEAFVGIGKVEGIQSQPAIHALRGMVGIVNDCLVAIEGEARRIGLFA